LKKNQPTKLEKLALIYFAKGTLSSTLFVASAML